MALGQVLVQVLRFFAVSLHSSTALWKHEFTYNHCYTAVFMEATAIQSISAVHKDFSLRPNTVNHSGLATQNVPAFTQHPE